jgi:hypothetical protein
VFDMRVCQVTLMASHEQDLTQPEAIKKPP